jgi:hypothetical protein
MTKEQLELKEKELNAAITQFEADKAALINQLHETRTRLIRNAVANAVGHFSFDNCENYEYDLEINYNNRIELSNINLNYTDALEESICGEIEDLFKVEGDDED